MIKMLKAKITQHDYKINKWWTITTTKREAITIDNTEAKRFWREIGMMTKHLDELLEDEIVQIESISKLGA